MMSPIKKGMARNSKTLPLRHHPTHPNLNKDDKYGQKHTKDYANKHG
jgi:hypothetical protein